MIHILSAGQRRPVWITMEHLTIRSYINSRPFEDRDIATMCVENLLKCHNEERIRIMAFCLMPDHLHLCAEPGKAKVAYTIGRWKSFVTQQAWKLGWQGKLWQAKHHPKPVSSGKGIEAVIDYILKNPEQAGLVTHWRDWPYWATPVYGACGFR